MTTEQVLPKLYLNITQRNVFLNCEDNVSVRFSMTLDAAEIDTNHSFAKGQIYTAISRVRSMDSLRILNLEKAHIKAEEIAVQWNCEQGKH